MYFSFEKYIRKRNWLWINSLLNFILNWFHKTENIFFSLKFSNNFWFLDHLFFKSYSQKVKVCFCIPKPIVNDFWHRTSWFSWKIITWVSISHAPPPIWGSQNWTKSGGVCVAYWDPYANFKKSKSLLQKNCL